MNEETIFAAALELSSPERPAFLVKACGHDTALRQRLEGLLAASDRAGNFMARPAAAAGELPTAIEPGEPTPQDVTVTRDSSAPPAEEQTEATAFLAPSARPDSLGRIGHYEVLEVLGKGGFGIVFRAFDDVLQRVVAVKVMAPQLAATSPARKRFLREARSSAQVRHENVVQVYEIGEQPLPYLAMEFIPGQTLQQRLDRCGPLEIVEVVRIGRQIAEGLAAAHATDLIHRDIKPSNILIEGGHEKAKLTDFGLARAADDASISQSGIIAGTPMYMAPEQAKGEKLDQRADLFSFGSVLYQMVSGRPPFRANGTVAVLKRVAEDTPRDIREIIPETPQWLCNTIAKLHAKNPDERYQSAREIADVLADCEQQLKAHGSLKDFSRIPGGKPRHPRRRIMAMAAALAILLPLIAWGVYSLTRPTAEVPDDRAQLAINWDDKDLVVMVYGADGSPYVSEGATKGAGMSLKPGQYTIRAQRGGEVVFNQSVTLGPREQRGFEVPPLPDTSWVQLFNGKDLTGWRTHPDQRGGWEVGSDGLLVGRPTTLPTHLFTERGNYENFHFRVEAMISQGGDSGQFFRCEYGLNEVHPTNAILKAPRGYEANLTLAPQNFFKTGSLWGAGWPPVGPKDSLITPDIWFTQEVIARGNHIVIKVNGVITVDYTDTQATFQRGHLALQAWVPDTVVRFRKIEIKELPQSPLTPEERAREESGKLNGEWLVRQGRVGQEPLTGQDFAGMKMSFANGKFVLPIRDDSGYPWALTGIYTIDAVKMQLAFKFNHEPLDTPAVLCSYRVDGDKLVLDFPEPKSGDRGTGSTELFVPDQRIASQRNLTSLGIAMHNYMAANKDALPQAAITKDGKPLLSWRVALLPHLEQGELYRQFKLDEPWDSEHNKKLIEKMPKIYAIPGAAPPPGHTHYQVFVGPGTAFEPRGKGLTVLAFFDGMSNTILVVEAADPVIWTKPDDLAYDAKKPLPKLGVNKDGAHLLMGDGSVWRLSQQATEKGIRGAIVRNDGEAISNQYLVRIPWRGPALYLELRRNAAPPTVPHGVPKTTAAPFTDADVKRIAALPAAQQVEEVRKELMRRNPGFDGQLRSPSDPEPRIANGTVTHLAFSTDNVSDISPVRALTGLLEFHGTGSGPDLGQLTDLSPLKGMQLYSLGVANNPRLTDLSALQGLRLKGLSVANTGVANLEVLKDMSIERLWIQNTPIADLSPLAGKSLKTLHCAVTKVKILQGLPAAGVERLICDLSQLPDESDLRRLGVKDLLVERVPTTTDPKRLRELGPRLTHINNKPAAEFSKELNRLTASAPFTDADFKRIAALPAKEQIEEVRKELMKRNPGFDGKVEHNSEGKNVTELRINTDKVTDIAPIRVFNALQVLELSGSEAGRQANGQLADLTPLKGMNLSNLIGLSLANTKIDDNALVHFKDCKNLTGIWLQHTQVTSAGMVHLKNCKKLTKLGLKHTLVDDAGLAQFKDWKELTSLDLGELAFTEKGLAILNGFANLSELWLNGKHLNDAGLAQIMDCKNLTSLHLGGSQVTDAGLVHLRGCNNLTKLWLDGTQITNEGLTRLGALKELRFLNLRRTKVTKEKVEELARALPNCKIEWDGGD